MLLEFCVTGMADARAAIDAGADRLELCQALDTGGLTPPAGLMQAAARLPVPVVALIRPRPGDFTYDADEIAQMAADVATARICGLYGVAIGALTGDGRLDRAALAPLIAAAGPMSLTLHRAFDLTPDPFAALETAAELGFDRILTSGQAARAVDGAALIARLVQDAAGRLVLLAAAGIDAAALPDLAARTGITEAHASASHRVAAPPDLVARGFAPAAGLLRLDPLRAAALAAARDRLERTMTP